MEIVKDGMTEGYQYFFKGAAFIINNIIYIILLKFFN